ncbi:MAG TPA: SMC-Scp complex subunit ScpB [Thermoguttaceae bacterium]|nr:SMC-Scp complex subunit ScpB [Thermoguttaceae bacterium]
MSNVSDATPEEDQPQELSLRSLSEAFAEALARQRAADGVARDQTDADEADSTGPTETDSQTASMSAEETAAGTADSLFSGPATAAEKDDVCPINPRTILEAMLFVGDPANQPLESQRAASLMRDVEPRDVSVLVGELNRSYEQNGCPYRVVDDAGGFRLTLDDAFHRVREKFYGRIREARLSQAAIDVLAIVAYRQPLAADQVNRLRNKPSHHILCQLVRRRLLRVERSAEKPRKPLYRTTERFLELFELKSLADLPESETLDAN